MIGLAWPSDVFRPCVRGKSRSPTLRRSWTSPGPASTNTLGGVTESPRISGENLFDFFIAQSSQRFEPPRNPGRFNWVRVKGFALATGAHPPSCFQVGNAGHGYRIASLTWGRCPIPYQPSLAASFSAFRWVYFFSIPRVLCPDTALMSRTLKSPLSPSRDKASCRISCHRYEGTPARRQAVLKAL
jgi:hypothetical protein